MFNNKQNTLKDLDCRPSSYEANTYVQYGTGKTVKFSGPWTSFPNTGGQVHSITDEELRKRLKKK